MSGSWALRKLLFANTEEADTARRGYHYSGSYEPLLATVVLSQPAAVTPKSGFRVACVCLGSCLVACVTMKRRHHEKWWLGVFVLSGFYYNAVKAHKVENGLVGHQSGFFAAAMGALGCGARLAVRAGSVKATTRQLSLFIALMWYEVGRYHVWEAHATEFKREVSPERYYNLLSEYVPQGIEVEFLPYRGVHSR